MEYIFNKKIEGARLVVETIKLLGIKYIFVQPGSQILPITDALYDENINVYGVINEANGIIMADVVSRLSGQSAIMITTAGPGATNCVTGIATAYNANSPVILISATLPLNAPKEAFHGVDDPKFLLDIFKSITKYSTIVSDINEIPHAIIRAHKISTTGRFGPSYVGIVDKILNEKTETIIRVNDDHDNINIKMKYINIDELVNKLLISRFPIFYVGKSVLRAHAENELIQLIDIIKTSVISPRHYPDVFPNDNFYYFGTISDRFSRPDAIYALSNADLVISLGIRVGSLEDQWLKKYYKGEIIYIDSDLDDGIENIKGIFGDIKKIILQILERATTLNFSNLYRQNLLVEVNNIKNKTFIESEMYYTRINNGFNPFNILKVIKELVKDDSIIVGDAGSAGGAWLNDTFIFKRPGTFLHSRNYDGMGFSVPASIAAKLVFSEREVIAITGDGGFLFGLSDLPLARKYTVNPVIVVFNDSKFGMIWQEQQERGGKYIATDLPKLDFAQIATSIGFNAVRVNSIEEFRKSLSEALNSNILTIIDVPVDPSIKPPSRLVW